MSAGREQRTSAELSFERMKPVDVVRPEPSQRLRRVQMLGIRDREAEPPFSGRNDVIARETKPHGGE